MIEVSKKASDRLTFVLSALGLACYHIAQDVDKTTHEMTEKDRYLFTIQMGHILNAVAQTYPDGPTLMMRDIAELTGDPWNEEHEMPQSMVDGGFTKDDFEGDFDFDAVFQGGV